MNMAEIARALSRPPSCKLVYIDFNQMTNQLILNRSYQIFWL